MSNRAKVIPIVFLVAAVLSAVAASAAGAADHYRAPLAPTVVTGTDEYNDTSSANDFIHNNIREPVEFLNT